VSSGCHQSDIPAIVIFFRKEGRGRGKRKKKRRRIQRRSHFQQQGLPSGQRGQKEGWGGGRKKGKGKGKEGPE